MTTGDWDFDSANWILDTSLYVSAPASWRPIVNTPVRALIKTSVVPIDKVKEGMLATFLRCATFGGYWVDYIFRLQDDDNYYYVRVRQWSADTVYVTVVRRYGGVETTLIAGECPNMPRLTWNKARVIWWNDLVGVVIRVQRWNGSEWVNLIDETWDSLNYWKDIGGRVGFSVKGVPDYSPPYPTNIDDSEIYGKV